VGRGFDQDSLADLGIAISDRTVSNVLRRNGIPPAPRRRMTNDWRRFLAAHWPHLAAIDFATFEVPDGRGRTTRHHALYAIRLATREVRLVGITDQADGAWTESLAHSLREHVAYDNRDRNHQALDGHRSPAPVHDRPSNAHGTIVCRSRLGKTLNFYYREAV
jgi:hypothetical protein